MVPLAAPTTADDRLAAIGRAAQGFVYCVALTGVTGRQVEVGDELRGFLDRARALTDAPLGVGFGIRTPADVAAVGAIADGVIVGSELIRRVGAAPDAAGAAAEVAAFCEEAVAALRELDGASA